MSENVIDLDILKPQERYVKLHGETIDVSFVPVGATFEIDALIREMSLIDKEKIDAGDVKENESAFNLAVRLAAAFCRRSHPKFDEEFFKKSVNSRQLGVLVQAIRDALNDSYRGVEEYGKN